MKQFTTIYCRNIRNGKPAKRWYVYARFAMPQDAYEYYDRLIVRVKDSTWKSLFRIK